MQLHYPAEFCALGDVQGVIDFRNYLAHQYGDVSQKIVWDVLKNDLPPLMKSIESLLRQRGLIK